MRLYSLTKTAGLIIWNSLGFFLKLGQPFFIFSTVWTWLCILIIDIGEDVFGIFGRFYTFFSGICALMISTSVFLERWMIHVFPLFFLKKFHHHSRLDIIYHQDHINQGLTINTQGQQEKCRHKMSLCQFFHFFPAFDHWCVTMVLEILLRVSQHS